MTVQADRTACAHSNNNSMPECTLPHSSKSFCIAEEEEWALVVEAVGNTYIQKYPHHHTKRMLKINGLYPVSLGLVKNLNNVH